jgi:hypothetical protein
MSTRAILALVSIIVSVTPRVDAQAAPVGQTRPDFVGKWVLDTTRSNRDGVLRSLTLTVSRSGDTLSVLSEGDNGGGPFTTATKYGFDGKPWSNPLGPATLMTTTSWDGATLVFNSTGNANGRAVTVVDRWTLDSMGMTLTRQSTFAIDGQKRSETLVLTRRQQKP